MKNKLKVLLATDYSEAVKTAEHYAVRLAQAAGASLTVVHSYDVPLLPDHPTPLYEEKLLLSDVYKDEETRMKDHINGILATNSIAPLQLEFNYKLLRGEFPECLNEEAKLMNADFLVIGTHGAKGFLGRLFGNHAWQIMKSSDVPVLVIPKDAIFVGLKKIVFATEYRSGEIPAIKYLAGLAEKFNAELTVLHVTYTFFPTKEETELAREFHRDILEATGSNKIKLITIKGENVTEGLESYCAEHNSDLLVLSHEKKDLFDKVLGLDAAAAKKITFHSKLPVLSIPDYYKTKKYSFWDLLNDVEQDIENI
ncbi:MAG: universal stress protein [Bacteroidia bacterium]|nr:universal stress protein [Bacteroidia bacterium]